MLENKRENNYDLLRIFSAFAVVMLHVAYVIILQFDGMGVPNNCTFPAMMLNCITRFAVPCFMMLSGAFNLANEKNADYKYFYRKSVKNIGITGACFCILYVIYDVAKLGLSVFVLHRHSVDMFFSRLFSIIANLLKGKPYIHLWYLFAIIGIYLAIPFVIRLAIEMSKGGGEPLRKDYNHISYPCKYKFYN